MNPTRKTRVTWWLKNVWLLGGQIVAEGTPGAKFVKQRRVPANTPGAVKIKTKERALSVQLPGEKTRRRLATNKTVAIQEHARLLDLQERGELDKPSAKALVLADLLARYRQTLTDEGVTLKHVRLVLGRLQALFAGAELNTVADLNAPAIVSWLAQQQRPQPPIALPTDQATWTTAEVAQVLGVKPHAIRPALERLGLAKTVMRVNGVNHWPRATVQALADYRARVATMSVQTANYYLVHAKAFSAWLTQKPHQYVPTNPLADLSANPKTDTDRRHARRELSVEELRRLLEVARTSSRTMNGLDSPARYLLYLVAMGTGFRAGGLAVLTPAHFNLNEVMPTVTLPALANKSRKEKVQPLPVLIAQTLVPLLAVRATDELLWPISWHERGAECLRIDLDAANIPYIVHEAGVAKHADFHALRHSYITAAARTNPIHIAQALAGHSVVTTTMLYVHTQKAELAAGVQKLPEVVPINLPRPPSMPTESPVRGACRGAQTAGTPNNNVTLLDPSIDNSAESEVRKIG
jgi:integrase